MFDHFSKRLEHITLGLRYTYNKTKYFIYTHDTTYYQSIGTQQWRKFISYLVSIEDSS